MKKKVLFFYSEDMEVYRRLLEKHVPEAEFFFCQNREEVEKYAPQAEIAFVGMSFPQDLFKKMPKLEWVQVMAAGVEKFIQNAEQFKNIPVCRVLGVFGKYMAEYALAYICYFSQDIPRVLKAQREKRWDYFLPQFVYKKTLGVMGLGNMGTAVAQKAKSIGMRVVSWDMVKKDVSIVDHQYGPSELRDFLKEPDFLVVTLPSTPETANFVNRETFRAMKKTAFFINISRGAIVDEEALIEALKTNTIAGAVLDVMKQEPLPPESPLWDCPNLILSAHISGPNLPEEIVEVFKENFQRYLKKEPLKGLINFERGF
jgi:phosphoglycerate dehydrogenase-like enzyme